MEKNSAGQWRSTTWQTFHEAVEDLARRLFAAGMQAGDQVAILMPNSIRWETIQHAVYRLGGIVIGLDGNDPRARMEDIFTLCRPKYLFVEDPKSLDLIPASARQDLEMIIYSRTSMQGGCDSGLVAWDTLPPGPKDAPLAVLSGEQTATIIFTSGTTGRPKALSFQQCQLTQAMAAIATVFESLPNQAHTACWLPLANPFQRMVNLCALKADWKTFMVPDPTAIMSQVHEISPHLFAAVPRFYEKLYQSIRQQMEAMLPILKKITLRAMQVETKYQDSLLTGKPVSRILKLRHIIADIVILKRIRSLMGSNLRYLVSGSAPAGPELIKAFQGLGWQLLEAYGISENIVPMAVNTPDAIRPGSVGRPLAGNEVRIAPDQEIWVKGDGLALEARHKLKDGYLQTGDLGRLDANGYLRLIGRKGDMFKLSTGRKIIPRAIEQSVEQIDAVEHCVAAGRFQKYVVVLVNITEVKWKQLVQQNGTIEGVHAYLRREVKMVCRHLPAYSRPVDLVVTRDSFSPLSGELTSNLKLRRNFILNKYAESIEGLYRESKKNFDFHNNHASHPAEAIPVPA